MAAKQPVQRSLGRCMSSELSPIDFLPFTEEELGKGLVALGYVCINQKLLPVTAIQKAYRKQFVDHLVAMGLSKDRANEVYQHYHHHITS